MRQFAFAVLFALTASQFGSGHLHADNTVPVSKPDFLPGPSSNAPGTAASIETPKAAPVCGTKQHCGDMATCAEAYYYLTACGLGDLDRDSDGIPCETICGKTLGVMKARMNAQPFSAPAATSTKATSTSTQALMGDTSPGSSSSEYDCNIRKTTCKQMISCEEATFYLQTCGISHLDRNHDGVPCNGLCK